MDAGKRSSRRAQQRGQEIRIVNRKSNGPSEDNKTHGRPLVNPPLRSIIMPTSLKAVSAAATSPVRLARRFFRPLSASRGHGLCSGVRMSTESYVKAVESIPSGDGNSNVLQFLIESCPDDVLGKVLCYAGPRKARALSQANRYFRDFMKQEQVWRVFCEEFNKWTHDNQSLGAEPSSWREYYCQHPCVPMDYDTIQGALSSASIRFMRQVRHVCVLLLPGSAHVVKNTLLIDTTHSGIVIRIETMRSSTGNNPASIVPAILVSDFEDHPYLLHPLKIHTEKRDFPLFKVFQGELHLSNVEVRHSSAGSDIWNGNAAIHIEPRHLDAVLRPTRVCLRSVNVTSKTGRGVVLRGEARLSIVDSYIHHCAGTGVYIGFSGHGYADRPRNSAIQQQESSETGAETHRAVVRDTDIVDNGVGNRQGPVGRGHSGVYLEEGTIDLSRCSIARNSSSGICVATKSALEANDDNGGTAPRLDMSHCYLVDNGGTPLDVTNVERHRLHQNVMRFTGSAPVVSSVFGSVLCASDAEDDEEVQDL